MTPSESSARREALYTLMGDLPDRDRPITCETIWQREQNGYLLEMLRLDLNGIEAVPAYLARPLSQAGPLPAVLFNHSHGGHYEIGKEELIAPRDYLQEPPYARVLTEAGYLVMCIDTWNFGERRGRTESALFKELLWKGQVLWGLMVYDSLRAVDYLISRPEVDAERLGTLGISMGSTMAWWLAALDERIKACVDLCCLTDFDELIRTHGLDCHGLYYYVPGLLKQFDTAAINALIAPRAHLALAGINDPLTPPAGLDKIEAALQAIYVAAGVPERWKLLRYATGHFETAHGRKAILEFLAEFL